MKAKNTTLSITLVLISGLFLFLSNCKEDEPIRKKTPTPTTPEYSKEGLTTFLRGNAPVPQNFSFDAATGGNFTSTNGFQYSFPANAFRKPGGTLATGQIDVTVTEYASTADMVYSGITTTSGNALLASGGMFNISATQQGNPISLGATYSVNIPSTDIDGSMQVFQGQVSLNANGDSIINWVSSDSTPVNQDTVSGGGLKFYYKLNLNFLSWCNLDRYLNNPVGVQVRLVLPEEHNYTNTLVYMVFDYKGKSSVVYLFDDQDPLKDGEFNSGNYYLPLDWKIKLIALSEIDGEPYYALVNSTIIANHLETVDALTKISEEELNTIIKGL